MKIKMKMKIKIKTKINKDFGKRLAYCHYYHLLAIY